MTTAGGNPTIKAHSDADAVGRKLAKLRKRGAIDQDNNPLPPKLASRPVKKDAVRSAMFSKEATVTVLGAADAYNVSRCAVGSVKTTDHYLPSFDAGKAADIAGGSGAAFGAVAYGVSLGINAAKLDASIKSEEANIQAAAKEAKEAFEYVQSKGKRGSADAYLKFVKATEPVIAAKGSRSSASLDQQVYGGNIVRYLSNMGSSVSSLASAVTKVTTGVVLSAASVASGALTVIAGAAEIVVAAAQREKVEADLQASRQLRRGLHEQWMKSDSQDQLKQGLNRALDAETRCREKAARRARLNNGISIAKGVLTVAAGVGFIVAASVATAGLILPIVAGAITAGCLTYAVIHQRNEARVARYAKRRQRQAQSLMATHSVDALKKMMQSTHSQARKRKVATVERKHRLSQDKLGRMRTVDVGSNGYLALQIRAHDVAHELGRLEWNDKLREALFKACENTDASQQAHPLPENLLETIQMLKAAGWDSTRIVALCQQATEQADAARCAALLRPQLAAAMGLPWTAEGPLPAKAYLGVLQELLDQAPAGKNQPDMPKLAREFRATLGETNCAAFLEAMKTLPVGKKDSPLVWQARQIALELRLLARASQERADEHPELAKRLAKIAASGELEWDMPQLPEAPAPASTRSPAKASVPITQARTRVPASPRGKAHRGG